MSFQQIQKPATATKKEKDILIKNNSIHQNHNKSFISKSNCLNFNFSNIGIFGNDNVIQRKPVCACGGKCPKCKATDHLTDIPNIQTKLKISQSDDPLEREADKVAEQIVGTNYINSNRKSGNKNKSKETINRKCSKCEEYKDKDKEKPIPINRKSNTKKKQNLDISNKTNNEIKNVLENDGAKPLDASTKKFMESRFGYDFSSVKIHADGEASKSASSVNALAYTIGNDIVFRKGLFQPATWEGKSLLAHELAHVVQQSSLSTQLQVQRTPDPDDEDEDEEVVMSGPRPIGLSLLNTEHMCGGRKCMTDEEIYGPSNEAIKRFDERAAKEASIGKAEYLKRKKKSRIRAALNALYEIVDEGRDIAKGTVQFLKGFGEGFITSFIDLFKGIYDIGKFIAQSIKFIAENAVELCQEIIKVTQDIYKLYKKDPNEAMNIIKEFGKGVISSIEGFIGTEVDDFVKKWNHKATKWNFRGYVIGYIVAEVVMFFFSFGIGTGVKLLGKLPAFFSKLGKIGSRLSGLIEKLAGKLAKEIAAAAKNTPELLKFIEKKAVEKFPINTEKLIGQELVTAGAPAGVRLGPVFMEASEGGSGSGKLAGRRLKTKKEDLVPAKTHPSKVVEGKTAGGVEVNVSEKMARRLRKISEALKDDTKWGNLSPMERTHLGNFYGNLVEELVEGIVKTGKIPTLDSIVVNAKLFSELRKTHKVICITEGKIASKGLRFDILKIDFEKGLAELIDLTAQPSSRHKNKLREYKKALKKMLGMPVEAKEMYYADKNGKLLEKLKEELIE